MTAPGSLLVVRLGAMGDVIHTIPAVTALRSSFPEMRIGWVIEQRWADLLCSPASSPSGPRSGSRPLVDFVHVVDTKRWRISLLSRETRRQITDALAEVREQRYEVAADFQGALKSALIAKFAGAKTVIGMEHPRESPARMFYQQRVEVQGTHVIEQYHSLAEAIAGKQLEIADALFPCNSTKEGSLPAGNLVVLNPGAGWATKQWPAEAYGAVARALAHQGLIPLVNYGPGEEALAKVVEEQSGDAARRISCSIPELIALMRHARLFIGGDTGPLHLAAALHVPVVAIFGPTDPARNGPYGTRSIVLRNPESRTSLSHTSTPDPGLLKITSEDVIAASRELLRAQHG